MGLKSKRRSKYPKGVSSFFSEIIKENCVEVEQGKQQIKVKIEARGNLIFFARERQQIRIFSEFLNLLSPRLKGLNI